MFNGQPGDVFLIRTRGIFGLIIRFGEWLQRKPDMHSHVAVLHHIDGNVAWFLEGRPGGLGWRPEKITGKHRGSYIASRWTRDNALQPKLPLQRQVVCAAMLGLLGAPYDWGAIAADAADALHLPEVWAKWGGKMPGHVVCSSSAAWAYRQAKLPAPEIGGGRFTEPADWDAFMLRRGWEAPDQAAAAGPTSHGGAA